MSASLFALERAAGRGEVFPAVEVLLDELEARGALGAGERIAELRAQIMAIARVRAATWTQQPQTAVVDLYARTLTLPELDAIRVEWDAALDARGPWLRPLRGWTTDAAVAAELGSSEFAPLDRRVGLRFEDEHTVVLGLREVEEGAEQSFRRWSWPQGQLEAVTGLEPIERRHRQDPRFERGEDAPLYRCSPQAEARQLPWPDFGHATAKMSADGRTIFVFGWFDENYGLLELVDEQSLEVLRKHEFNRPVAKVVERRGADELLVETYGGLFIVGFDGRQWERAGAGGALAWSPSGRYVCTADARCARVIDTAVGPKSTRGSGGMPASFSPDGARLVDGERLLDGRTGTIIARLDVHIGEYLEGGPAWPWWHVGNELIVSIHSGLQLWDVRSGEVVDTQEPLHVLLWEAIAYSASGRHYVRGRARHVTLGELPSGRPLTSLHFGVQVEALALSPSGEWVAAFGGQRVEVRDRAGELVGAGQLPVERESGHIPLRGGSLTFAPDERSLTLDILARTVSGRAQPRVICEWALGGGSLAMTSRLVEPPSSLPPNWKVLDGASSTFVHESGASVTLPCAGPWQGNPSKPEILACPGGLFELRDCRSRT